MAKKRTPEARAHDVDQTTLGPERPADGIGANDPSDIAVGTASKSSVRRRQLRERHDDHDLRTCPGCDLILGMDELEILLDEPSSTLYKRSTRGYPAFPRRLSDRHRVAVLCRLAKAYLGEVST